MFPILTHSLHDVIFRILKHEGLPGAPTSPHAFTNVMAKKKGGQQRFCFEFRYLNVLTRREASQISGIDDSLSKHRFFYQF